MWKFLKFSLKRKKIKAPLYSYAEAKNKKQLERLEKSYASLKSESLSLCEEATKTTNKLNDKVHLMEQRFNVVASLIDNVIIVKTYEKRWICINKYACEIFGVHAKEFVGKTNDELSEKYPELKPLFDILNHNEDTLIKDNSTKELMVSLNVNDNAVLIDLKMIPIGVSKNKVDEIIIIGHVLK